MTTPRDVVLPVLPETARRPGRTLVRARLAAGVTITAALVGACGTETAQGPEPERSVVQAPADLGEVTKGACRDAPHIVLRRSAPQEPNCLKSARGGYPGAATPSVG